MRLLWVDIESTGLQPERCSILELVVGLADLESPFALSTMDRFVLRFADEHAYGLQCEKRERPTDAAIHTWMLKGTPDESAPCAACHFDPVARAMHEKSGLLAECAESTTTMADVEGFLLSLVQGEPERGDDKPTLAGSTVHFDRGFLRAYAPRFEAKLSHRHYDVSAVKLFCESLGMPRIPKANAHTAVADVQESIAHARQCAEWLRRLAFSRLDPVHQGAFGGGHALPGVDPHPEPVVSRSTTREDRNPSVVTFPDGRAYDYATGHTDPASTKTLAFRSIRRGLDQKRGQYAIVACDAERDRDNSGLVGETVTVDGERFLCAGVERHALAFPMIAEGEEIALWLQPAGVP